MDLATFGSAELNETITGLRIGVGMFIYAWLHEEQGKRYVAEITSVGGDAFSCRFLHSNSTYDFASTRIATDDSVYRLEASVKANRGGSYPAGTRFQFNVYTRDPQPFDFEAIKEQVTVIVTFADSKSYLGVVRRNDETYEVMFPHSRSLYTFDRNWKILAVAGGAYPVGGSVNAIHARTLAFDHTCGL